MARINFHALLTLLIFFFFLILSRNMISVTWLYSHFYFLVTRIHLILSHASLVFLFFLSIRSLPSDINLLAFTVQYLESTFTTPCFSCVVLDTVTQLDLCGINILVFILYNDSNPPPYPPASLSYSVIDLCYPTSL